jgi:hypothetical protein
VAVAIALEVVAHGSGLGGVQRCVGGALVARSATVSLCELVPAASWWCPWLWSCGGIGRVSLLGDNDACENAFLLTRSGTVSLARRRHSLFGGDIGHLGCLPRLRLGPAASSSTWCFAGRSVRTLLFSFSFLCEKKKKKRGESIVLVGSSFSFEQGRREVVVPGGVWWLASTAELSCGNPDRCPNPIGTIPVKLFELIVSMSQSDR